MRILSLLLTLCVPSVFLMELDVTSYEGLLKKLAKKLDSVLERLDTVDDKLEAMTNLVKQTDGCQNSGDTGEVGVDSITGEANEAKMIFLGPGKILHIPSFTTATECDVPPYPTRGTPAATVVMEGKIWICGGWTNFDSGVSSCYQLTDGAWVPEASMTRPRSASAASVTSDGELFITGGYYDGEHLASTELLRGGIWQDGPIMDIGVYSHCQVTLGNTVYIIGGKIDSPAWKSTIRNVYSWTKGNKEWTREANMKQPRYQHACTVLGEDIVVIGGHYRDVQKSAEKFSSGEWTVLPELPFEMAYGHAGTLGDMVWAMSKWSEEIYTTTDLHTWNKTEVIDFPTEDREAFPAPLVTADMINCA